MNIDEFNTYLTSLPDEIMDVAPDIVAEAAVEYYKDAFRKKAFDGEMWVAGKPKKRGSLLVDTGNLMNSIQAAEVNRDKVVIQAGNEMVRYAKVHNEGFTGEVTVIKGGKHKKVVKGGDIFTRHMNIPKRQFMGESRELAEIIKTQIDAELDRIL